MATIIPNAGAVGYEAGGQAGQAYAAQLRDALQQATAANTAWRQQSQERLNALQNMQYGLNQPGTAALAKELTNVQSAGVGAEVARLRDILNTYAGTTGMEIKPTGNEPTQQVPPGPSALPTVQTPPPSNQPTQQMQQSQQDAIKKQNLLKGKKAPATQPQTKTP